MTTDSEVENCIRDALGLPADDQSVKIIYIRQSFMGTRGAIVRLRGVDANKLTEKGRIKIGWVYARGLK